MSGSPAKSDHSIKLNRVVSVLLGGLLLIAAVLKTHGLVVDPLSQDSFLLTPWMQIAIIEVEVLLGLWLVSGLANRASSLCALVFFVGMSCISLYLALEGQASCGCFGQLKVNPWIMVVVDLAAVVALGISLVRVPLAACPPVHWVPLLGGTPPSNADITVCNQITSPWLKSICQVVAMTAILFGLIAGGFFLFTDNPWYALARLRGETLSVEPTIKDLGLGNVGETRTFEVTLRNYSNQPIRVVGGTTSCACVATNDLPVTIPAGSALPITVTIRFTGSPGRFAHRYVLYNDSEERLTVARFSGSVVESSRTTAKRHDDSPPVQSP